MKSFLGFIPEVQEKGKLGLGLKNVQMQGFKAFREILKLAYDK